MRLSTIGTGLLSSENQASSNEITKNPMLRHMGSSDSVVSSSLLNITFEEGTTESKSVDVSGSSRTVASQSGYTKLVAKCGRDLFFQCTGETTCEKQHRPKPVLESTPSMIMLDEVMEVLSNPSSTLTPMDEESTGGVYQLRRQPSVYTHPSATNASLLLKGNQRRDIFENSKPYRIRTNSDAVVKSPSASNIGRNTSTSPVARMMARSKSENEGDMKPVRTSPLFRQCAKDLKTNELKAVGLKKRYNSRVAVFKPVDEETGAEISSKIGEPNSQRAGMVIGGGAKRERAAYLLDKNIGRFSNVPETALVAGDLSLASRRPTPDQNIRSEKRGSLQRFCQSDGSAEDNPMLRSKASVLQLQKIGLLDLRIFNTDRHGGNILCNKDQVTGDVGLIPIDHGLSLPDWHFLGEAFFDWTMWAQVEAPLAPETLSAIKSIDIDQDEASLKAIGFPNGCIATNKICTLTLKKAADFGLNLKDMSNIFTRPFYPGHKMHHKYLSPLENMIQLACERVGYAYEAAGTVDYHPPELEYDKMDLNELERLAFGDSPPPNDFYDAFVEVLESVIPNGEWKKWIQIQ